VSRNESRTVYYASIGGELTLYDLDVDGAALIKRGAVTLPVCPDLAMVWPRLTVSPRFTISSLACA